MSAVPYRRQADLVLDAPRELARVHRIAADAARRNPFETPEAAERRARYYEAEAERLEALAR